MTEDIVEQEVMSDADIQAANNTVELGEAMNRLYENEDFVKVFQKQFIEAWAITNAMNMSMYDRETRARTMEKMTARGYFVDFCTSTLEDAKYAKELLANC